MIDELQSWLSTVFAAITAIGVLFNIRQIVISGHKAATAAGNAESAARLASEHAIAATEAVGLMNENVQKIELATNSMKDALIESTAKASDLEGERRGLAAGRAEGAAKKNENQ